MLIILKRLVSSKVVNETSCFESFVLSFTFIFSIHPSSNQHLLKCTLEKLACLHRGLHAPVEAKGLYDRLVTGYLSTLTDVAGNSLSNIRAQ